MQEFIININDVNKRLDQFLLKKFPTINRALIYKYIRTNQIKVNRKRPEFDYRLQRNDVLQVYVDVSTSTKPIQVIQNNTFKLDVIYEDDNILVVNKPIGIISQPENDENTVSMQSLVINYLYQTKQYDPALEHNFVPSICHRLDRNTSGLMFAAKNAISLAEMNRILKEHEINKTYLCLVNGIPNPAKATLRAFHFKDAQKNLVYINKELKPGYKEIITAYEVIDHNDKYALLRIDLITGRTHQIRAHLNFIGHPIVGEQKYKSGKTQVDTRVKHQALVCYQMQIKTNTDSCLAYLNNKIFTLDKVWFKNLIK